MEETRMYPYLNLVGRCPKFARAASASVFADHAWCGLAVRKGMSA